TLRPTEIGSTPKKAALIGIQVQADTGSNFAPGVPTIAGLAPLLQSTSPTSSFALFAVNRDGLKLLQIAGANATTGGAYSLPGLSAGDANHDGNVDGLDATLVSAALGSTLGQSQYVAAADANRDGAIDATDVQLLGGNLGFTAVGPPVIHTSDL